MVTKPARPKRDFYKEPTRLIRETFKRLSKNTTGKDYVVSDIHGCFTQLEQALELLKFDPTKDRLIAVGDLIDRGDESFRAIEFLQKEWFHSVMGNHEWSLAFGRGFSHPREKWYVEKRGTQIAEDLVSAIMWLPVAIEIETDNGLVVVVHAEVRPTYGHWNEVKEYLASHDNQAQLDYSFLLTGRSRIRKQAMQPERIVEGVDLVISGHSGVKSPTLLGNSLFIDTGIVFGVKKVDDEFAALTIFDVGSKECYMFSLSGEQIVLNAVTMPCEEKAGL
ncbi:MAG: metallophosphoesterase [Thiotrichales bacterium]|jgi:serine/threonine protein phosphatase 1|nr:metallophosphoesterase [Thiotrichales bacterium]